MHAPIFFLAVLTGSLWIAFVFQTHSHNYYDDFPQLKNGQPIPFQDYVQVEMTFHSDGERTIMSKTLDSMVQSNGLEAITSSVTVLCLGIVLVITVVTETLLMTKTRVMQATAIPVVFLSIAAISVASVRLGQTPAYLVDPDFFEHCDMARCEVGLKVAHFMLDAARVDVWPFIAWQVLAILSTLALLLIAAGIWLTGQAVRPVSLPAEMEGTGVSLPAEMEGTGVSLPAEMEGTGVSLLPSAPPSDTPLEEGRA